jgi:hypothetical protein
MLHRHVSTREDLAKSIIKRLPIWTSKQKSAWKLVEVHGEHRSNWCMLGEGALRDLAALLSFSAECEEKRKERTSPQLDFAMSKKGGKGEAM